MKLKRTFLLLFCLLAGIVAGGMLANICAGVPVLSWLSYYNAIGFDAVTLDLSVLKLTFGLHMGVSVAQIFTIALSLFLYNKINIR
ncbi:MAG: DUF4321 domain-containing protein [Ruthenibacterium sp.]